MRIYPVVRKVITTIIGSGGAPAVRSTGTLTESLAMTARLAVPVGSEAESMQHSAVLTLAAGSESESLAMAAAMGSGSRPTGVLTEALSMSGVGSGAMAAGTEGESLAVASTILGRGYVTTAATAGDTVWTNPTRVQADDASFAQWLKTEGIGAGVATTSAGTLTATAPLLGPTPAGFTRSKVETLVHRNNAAVGLLAGDSALFSVAFQDKDGVLLQTVVNDSFTAAGSNADATVVADVTAAVGAMSDADLALCKFVMTATFVRLLAAVGTRSWTVNADSLSVRPTHTRSGIT